MSAIPGPPEKRIPLNFTYRRFDCIRKLSNGPIDFITLTTSSEKCELQSSLRSSLHLKPKYSPQHPVL